MQSTVSTEIKGVPWKQVARRFPLKALLCVGLLFILAKATLAEAEAYHKKGHNVLIAGQVNSLRTPVCFTEAQIRLIGGAWVEKGVGALRLMFLMLAKKNVCTMPTLDKPVVSTIIERVGEPMGEAKAIDGTKVTAYVVKVNIDGAEYFILSARDVEKAEVKI